MAPQQNLLFARRASVAYSGRKKNCLPLALHFARGRPALPGSKQNGRQAEREGRKTQSKKAFLPLGRNRLPRKYHFSTYTEELLSPGETPQWQPNVVALQLSPQF